MTLNPLIRERATYARHHPGFSLVELIVVVAIIAGLLALLVAPLAGVMEANRLTETGQSLAFRLSMARQIAVTENRPVELRFYLYEDENGAKGYHATQLFSLDEGDNQSLPLETAVSFSTGIFIAESPLSPLFASAGNGAAPPAVPAEEEPFKSMKAEYRQITFYPNGTTSLAQPLRQAYLTLCSTRADTSDAESPPLNYFTIQIDPINGTSKTYRPN